MSHSSEQRAFELFDELCDLPPEQQRAALDARCADDHVLRAFVERMLLEDTNEHTSWNAGEGAALLADELAHAAGTPERIGAYRILGELGRGGMGVVYEAEQDEPRRRVALKVVRSDLSSRDMLRRFRHEAHILGHLQHPGIAQIFEAGQALVGGVNRPFFAMEHIDGLALHRHATECGLTISQRVELMARVADAVQHAHRKGVIHRDLKPANILVVAMPADSIGQPKILDFGVSRLIERGDRTRTEATHAGSFLGTIAYMSPEQLSGRPDAVDVRSDVYALGANLFQLLGDRPPHDVADLSLIDAARRVSEHDAPHLGTIAAACRGDLETIVATALARDVDRRYGSASDLAAELRRYLSDQPIQARPATAFYHARKFARRHTGAVVTSAVALVALLAGLSLAIAGFVSANAESEAKDAALSDAEAERATSDAVTSFLPSSSPRRTRTPKGATSPFAPSWSRPPNASEDASPSDHASRRRSARSSERR